MAEPRTTFEVFTLFPDAVRSFASAGLLGRAVARGVVAVETTDFREFTNDRHRTVDDTPFGGGPGMVMKPEPVVAALEHVTATRGPMHRVLLTPSAPRFDQRAAERLAAMPRIGLLCGRYEGIDDRVREHYVDECLSLGDFVLGGGEVAALAIIEAVSRLVEGVVGNRESVERDSFATDASGPLLEFPQYTRPAVFRGHAVPDVLLGGDHEAIAAWRHRTSLARTWALRPDLRPRRAWPPVLPIYVVVAGEPDASWIDVLGRVRVAGLVVLGDDPERVVAWTRALGGRVSVAGFSGLAALRRRFKSRAAPPAIVGLVAAPRPGCAETPAALLDMLAGWSNVQSEPAAAGEAKTAGGSARRAAETPLVLVVGPADPPEGLDAVFAPPALDATAEPEPDPDPASASGLASPSAIVDISRPAHPALLVERAIAAIEGR